MTELRSGRNRETFHDPNPNPNTKARQRRTRRTAVNPGRYNRNTLERCRIGNRELGEKEPQQQHAPLLRVSEEGKEKDMDDEFDSGGGRSPDKAAPAEDEGSTAPIPERVWFYFIFRLLLLNVGSGILLFIFERNLATGTGRWFSVVQIRQKTWEGRVWTSLRR